jgi:hypothetical protein
MGERARALEIDGTVPPALQPLHELLTLVRARRTR